jgi:dienelactone hydrolase
MGGRLGLHFAAATPDLRAFVGYYPTSRDEPATELRPERPWEAAARMPCPAIVMYGGRDVPTVPEIQERIHAGLLASGQDVSWHVFGDAGHGFGLELTPTFDAAYTGLADLLVAEFLARHIGTSHPRLVG